MRKYGFLGLDLGGTGAKAGVFDERGKLLGFGQSNYEPSTSEKGHSEIPIEEIYGASRNCVRTAVKKSGANVLAMAVSSQGQTFVALDKRDRPLYPAIMWYDTRACRESEILKRKALSLKPKGELPFIEPIATAPKIMWLRRNYPEKMSKAYRYLLLPDYISYKLAGTAVMDADTASSTALYAYGEKDYSKECLLSAGIEKTQMSEIKRASEPIAKVMPKIAEDWNLGKDTMVVTGTNDQYAGAIGVGNCKPGIVSETTGSCLALVTLIKKLPGHLPDGILSGTFPTREFQFVLAYSKTAGLVLRWFNQEFCPSMSLIELERIAGNVPVGSKGVNVLPHFEGMVSPEPNINARGFICGLALHNNMGDVYRAILESVAFCLKENLEFLSGIGFKFNVIRSMGGGAKNDLWLQIKSDVTGLPVERPVITETATLGAAMIAAVGNGSYSNIRECSEKLYHVRETFYPDKKNTKLYEFPYRRYRELWKKIYK